MLTVTAETSLTSSLDDAWTALGRRESYLCYPGLSAATAPARGTSARARGALLHELDLPIVDRVSQRATLDVSRASRRPSTANGHRRTRRVGAASETDGELWPERRFALRGELVSIEGCWRLEPTGGTVRAHLTLCYDIAAALKADAVNTLRSRSPLPIRTDADAILSRAVDEFFETRFGEHAAAYCAALAARLERATPTARGGLARRSRRPARSGRR